MKTQPPLPTQIEEDIILKEIMTNFIKFTQNELRRINNDIIWERVYALSCITKGDEI